MPTPVEVFKKYAPSGQKLLLQGGVSILACIILGILYGMYIMEVPADLATENEALFRQGIGLGTGLFISFVPVTILIAKYIYQISEAKKLAMAEIMKSEDQ